MPELEFQISSRRELQFSSVATKGSGGGPSCLVCEKRVRSAQKLPRVAPANQCEESDRSASIYVEKESVTECGRPVTKL